MADYGFNTQLTPQTSQTSLGDMVNMARGIQAYQQSQQMNPLALQQQAQATEKGGLELQSTKQANQERLAVLPFLQDPANYTFEDGTIDTNKALKEIYARAPQTGHLYAKNLTDLANSQVQVAQNKQNLTQSGKTILVNTLGPDAYGGEQDPKVYIDKLNKAVKIDPSLKGIATAYTNMLSQLKPGEHIPSDMLKEIQGLQPASEQFSQFAPQAGTVNLGGFVQPTVTQKSVAGSTPSITPTGQKMQMTIGAGQNMEATGRNDLYGNPTAYVKDSSGKILGEVTIPAGVNQPSAGMPSNKPTMPPAMQSNQPAMPANAPVRPRPGESAESYKASSDLRINARQAAAQTPMQQFTANQIIDLADKAQTGVGAETLANIAGKLAVVPWTGNAATYFDNLGHYMTLQQASLAKSAGLSGTDQANQLAGQLSGTTNWTADSIKSTARVNRALSTATSMFNNGIENRFAVTKDPLAANDFQSQWSKTADINAIRLHDAIVNKDIAGIKEVIKAVDPQSMKLKNPMQSPNVQLLLKKWDVMNKLVKGQ